MIEALSILAKTLLAMLVQRLGSGLGFAQRNQLSRIESHVRQISVEQRRHALALARMEQAAHNRRILEKEQADHEFEPTGIGAGPGEACAAFDCILPRGNHGAVFQVGSIGEAKL